MDNSPIEIKCHIFSFLNELELLSALQVCKTWYEIFNKIYKYEVGISGSKNKQLQYICEVNQVITLTRFMKSNSNLNWNWGLYGACKGGNINIINMMIDKGAYDWNWGLDGACKGGHIDIVKMMIANGADNCGYCNKTMEEHLE